MAGLFSLFSGFFSRSASFAFLFRCSDGADLSNGRFPSTCRGQSLLRLLAMRWYQLTVTIGQLHIFNALYLILLVVVVIITRASMRRIVGALKSARSPLRQRGSQSSPFASGSVGGTSTCTGNHTTCSN